MAGFASCGRDGAGTGWASRAEGHKRFGYWRFGGSSPLSTTTKAEEAVPGWVVAVCLALPSHSLPITEAEGAADAWARPASLPGEIGQSLSPCSLTEHPSSSKLSALQKPL